MCYLIFSPAKAQVGLGVQVKSASVSTTCSDLFGNPNIQWSVNVGGEGWVTYPPFGPCFTSLPNIQYSKLFDCLNQLKDSIQICFKVFDNDAFLPCNISESCSETICKNFPVPGLGSIQAHTLKLPDNLSSSGELNFEIGLLGDPLSPENDFVCNAIDFGVIASGSATGNAGVSSFYNYCATNHDEPNPLESSGWGNDRGVWFKFQTSANPGTSLNITGRSDPSGLGDPMYLQFALYESTGGSCEGPFNLIEQQYDWTDRDEYLEIECPEPGKTYYLLVDGPLDGQGNAEGYFGLQISDNGVPQPVLQIDTVLCYGQILDLGSQVFDESGTFVQVYSQPDGCDSTLIVNLEILEPLQIRAYEVNPVSLQGLSDGAAGVEITGGQGGYTYLWSNGAETPTLEDVPAGVYCVEVWDEYGCVAEDCITISTAITPILVDFKNDTLLCHGDADGQLQFSISGGDVPYHYFWESQETGLSGEGEIPQEGTTTYLNHLPAGKYLLNLFDNSSLGTSLLMEVVAPSPLHTRLDTSLCEGETLEIGGNLLNTTGPIYEVLTSSEGCDSIVSGFLSVHPQSQTFLKMRFCSGESFTYDNQTYESSVSFDRVYTSSNGCDSTVSVELTFLEELEVSIFQAQKAGGYQLPGATVLAQATGGSGNYSYDWQNGTEQNVASGLLGGMEYCVKVTDDAGCVTERCIFPEYESDNIAFVENHPPSCHGAADGELLIKPGAGKPPFRYYWEMQGTSLKGEGQINENDQIGLVANLQAGTYLVTIADANVTTEKSIPITGPDSLQIEVLHQLDISCPGECNGQIELSVLGGTAPYSYDWDGDVPGISQQLNLCAGSYQVTVSDANACTARGAISITEPTEAFELTTEVLENVSCFGASDGRARVYLSEPEGPFQINWSNGQTGLVANQLAPGNYYVSVVNGAGCLQIDTITIGEPEELRAIIQKRDVNCRDGAYSGSIALESIGGGVSPYLFSLNDHVLQQFPVFENLTTGTYQLKIEDSNGCFRYFEAVINEPPQLELFLEGDTSISLGQSLSLKAASNYESVVFDWTTNGAGASCFDCPEFTYPPLRSFVLTVEGTDPITGCSVSQDLFIRVDKDRHIFVPNAFSPNNDGVNDFVTVYGGANVAQVISFRVYDRYGALLHEAGHFSPNDEAPAWRGRVKNRIANSGVYIYYAEVEFIDGEKMLFKGDIALLR